MTSITLPALRAQDTNRALEAVHLILNRCEEDGIPEPNIEIDRFGGTLTIEAKWYPQINPSHRDVDPAKIEETFDFAFIVRPRYRTEHTVINDTLVEFTVNMAGA